MVNFDIFCHLGVKAPPIMAWTKLLATSAGLLRVPSPSTNPRECANFCSKQSVDLTPDLEHLNTSWSIIS